ncbi:MAG: hypothetical protein WBM04_07295 [Candidatus Korobacteraceae bacterium]
MAKRFTEKLAKADPSLTKEAAERLRGTLLVGAPRFSRGKLGFSPAEDRSILRMGFSPGFFDARR